MLPALLPLEHEQLAHPIAGLRAVALVLQGPNARRAGLGCAISVASARSS